MNSSVVVGLLRMKQCLHQIYDLVFSVSIASLPGSRKVLRLDVHTLGVYGTSTVQIAYHEEWLLSIPVRSCPLRANEPAPSRKSAGVRAGTAVAARIRVNCHRNPLVPPRARSPHHHSRHPHPHTAPRPRSARRYALCVDRPTPLLLIITMT
jgi:hypothetical protein